MAPRADFSREAVGGDGWSIDGLFGQMHGYAGGDNPLLAQDPPGTHGPYLRLFDDGLGNTILQLSQDGDSTWNDVVKIDGAFVQHIMSSEDDRAFVRTLVDLARRLNLKTVAEWVQDDAAAAMLQAWGCDYLQGALIGLASTERPWLASTAKAM